MKGNLLDAAGPAGQMTSFLLVPGVSMVLESSIFEKCQLTELYLISVLPWKGSGARAGAGAGTRARRDLPEQSHSYGGMGAEQAVCPKKATGR